MRTEKGGLPHARPLAFAISALLLLSFASYHRVLSNGFITFFDDNNYVTENRTVQNGITAAGFIWAFTAFHAANWHPVTWLSHMTDIWFFGNTPALHHLTSLVIHFLNTVLLFLFLALITSAFRKSLAVSALFSVHPLHVEAVAWVAERKELLGTFFGLLSLISYYCYTERPRKRTYILTLFLFTLSLMSKPMLVTLPCLLLLLDYHPLKRTGSPARLVYEKLPFFLLSAASSILTIHAQKSWGAVKMLVEVPLGPRLLNAVTSYASYIVKTLLPFNLSVFYPYSKGSGINFQFVLSVLILLSITIIILRNLQKAPIYTVGWLWYLGTLFPVIGIIQAGNQAMADRYTYFPLTGLFLIIVWGAGEIAGKFRKPETLSVLLTLTAIFACTTLTNAQLEYWKNNLTLFQRAADVTSDNALAHNHLGAALLRKKRHEEAKRHFLSAIRIDPGYAAPHVNLANVFMLEKNYPKAVAHYRKAVGIAPDAPFSRYNLAVALLSIKRDYEAVDELKRVITLKPDFIPPYLALGAIALSQKDITEALALFRKVLDIEPGNLTAKEYVENIVKTSRDSPPTRPQKER